MLTRSRAIARLLGFIVLAAIIAGCSGGGGGPTPPGNHAPVISNIIRYCASPLASGSLAWFIIDATDADGNTLEYSIDFTAGSTWNTISMITGWVGFNAPDVTSDTVVTLTFTVSDGHGGEDTSTEQVNVAAPELGNNAPTIDSFTSTSSLFHSGETVTLTVLVSDLDGDLLQYTWDWFQFFGTLTEVSPGVVTYEAPTVTEEYGVSVYVTVDDGHGQHVEGNVNLTIQP